MPVTIGDNSNGRGSSGAKHVGVGHYLKRPLNIRIIQAPKKYVFRTVPLALLCARITASSPSPIANPVGVPTVGPMATASTS